MKIEIELTSEQIQCFIDFHRSIPYGLPLPKKAHEVLQLIDRAFSAALESETGEISLSNSGRCKLLWQIHQEEALNAPAPTPGPAKTYQDPRKTGSVSFWSWVDGANKS